MVFKLNPIQLFTKFVQKWHIGPRLFISYGVLLMITVALAGFGLYAIKDCEARLSSTVALTQDRLQDDDGAQDDDIAAFSAQLDKTVAAERQTMSRIMLAMTGLILFAVICGFIPAYIITRSIADPVNEVVKVAEEAASGDLRHTVDIDQQDEIGRLATDVNTMLTNMRRLMSEIHVASDSMMGFSRELAASAESVGQSGDQVARTIDQLARGAEEQAKSATMAGQTAGVMADSIKSVDESLLNMVTSADQAARTADEGHRAVATAIDQMRSIRTTVDGSAKVVRALDERSREITTIVDAITGIADQTNLLALNAAIEAARAGEQGRGFAVVAEEVRKLADQSKQAADRIGTLIREVRANTDQAVRAIDEGAAEAARGSEAVTQAGSAFSDIGAAVRHVATEIHAVSQLAVSMEQESQKVVAAVESIATITQQSAAGAEEVNAASEEQTAQVREIVASTGRLARLAEDLNGALTRFTV